VNTALLRVEQAREDIEAHRERVCLASQHAKLTLLNEFEESVVLGILDKIKLITREVGCSARKSIAGAGPFVYFLSGKNVYRIEAGEELKLRWLDEPVSYPIDDIMQRVNETYSVGTVAYYYDNRYHLALPLDDATRNSHILVYHIARKRWESLDTVPGVFYPDNLLVAAYGDQTELFGSNFEGGLWVFAQNEDGDEVGTTGDPATDEIPVSGQIKTRLYTAGDDRIKRWTRAQASVQIDDGDDMEVTPLLEDPDGTGEVVTLSGTASGDPLKRFRIARRGRAVQLVFDTNAGRPEVKTVSVEGAVAARDTRGFS